MDPITIRHDLHRRPELADKEFATQAYIRELLTSWGIEHRAIAGTGLLGIWSHGSGPYRLLRADMDALPLVEATGVSWSSENPGCMHACGHDVHLATLLGVIDRVRTSALKANLLFLFQPAEEGGGGADRAIPDLKTYQIAEAWAMHVTDDYPLGTVACRPGLLFASAWEIDSVFHGRSSHVAFHRDGRDAILGACDLLENLYNRDWGNVVARFGMIEGGRVRNAVADECRLRGTIRTESRERSGEMAETIGRLGAEIAARRELRYEQSLGARYPQVMVDPDLYKKFCRTIPVTECEMRFTGEDFGFISLTWPSLLFWFGTRESGRERVGLHHPAFLPPDATVPAAIETFWKILTG